MAGSRIAGRPTPYPRRPTQKEWRHALERLVTGELRRRSFLLGGLMVAGKNDQRGAALNFTPAPARLSARYERVPLVASE